jgi:hypothetical protein
LPQEEVDRHNESKNFYSTVLAPTQVLTLLTGEVMELAFATRSAAPEEMLHSEMVSVLVRRCLARAISPLGQDLVDLGNAGRCF